MKTTKVKVVLVHEEPNTPCWPCIDHDFSKEEKRIMTTVREMNPDMEFDLVRYSQLAQAQADYEKDLGVYDGVLVLNMTCWKGIDIFYAENSKTGIPTIIADVPYCGSGQILTKTIPAVREGKLPVPVLATLNYAEIGQAVKLFDVLAKMKRSTILVITNQATSRIGEAFEKEWGCRFIYKTSGDVTEYMKQADLEAAKEIADRWMKEALQVREASREDILQSAVLHIALKQMMTDCDADAVTVDCLTLSYEGDYDNGTHMYPCLSHYEMLNQGKVAVCEADLSATVTAMLAQYLTDRPGFVSDPVIDTSSNQIIYAHCVGCTKIFGKNDSRQCQYAIRSHAEDKKGASVQIFFPAGEKLTNIMVYPAQMNPAVIHSSKSVGNVGFDEGCRSKLAAETNAEAILNNWTGGWHRLTVFGDYKKQFMNLFKMKNLSVIEEDK